MGSPFGLLGQAPHEGDVVRLDGVRMEVVETDGPRIVNVDIILKPRPRGFANTEGDTDSVSDGSDDDLIPGADSSRSHGGGPF